MNGDGNLNKKNKNSDDMILGGKMSFEKEKGRRDTQVVKVTTPYVALIILWFSFGQCFMVNMSYYQLF